MQRVGQVVELKAECEAEYRLLHADDSTSVRALLRKHNLTNFSIFLREIDGRLLEFCYFEYIGDDYDADLAALAAEPKNARWLAVTDPMQRPLPGSGGWAPMESIFHND